jgi:hypothetical protein
MSNASRRLIVTRKMVLPACLTTGMGPPVTALIKRAVSMEFITLYDLEHVTDELGTGSRISCE